MRRGVARLVDVPAYVEVTRDKLMICDKMFRAVEADDAHIDKRFIAYVPRIHHMRAQIERGVSTMSGMMKNVSKPVMMGLTFPLAPKNDQVDMVQTLAVARAVASKLREQTRDARAQVRVDVEFAVHAAEDATVAAELVAAQS